MADINFSEVFRFDVSPVEIFIRGTLVYLTLFTLLRTILKRETAGIGITDLLVIVLIADASQNAMAGSYQSVPDGIILVATIIFWSYLLNWLGYRFSFFQRLIKPGKLLLVKGGKMIRRNMKKELLTEDELMSEIRLSGVKDLKHVAEAYMESDGRISIVSIKEDEENPKNEKKVIT